MKKRTATLLLASFRAPSTVAQPVGPPPSYEVDGKKIAYLMTIINP